MRSSNPAFSRRRFRCDDGSDGSAVRQPQPTAVGAPGADPFGAAPANPYVTNPFAEPAAWDSKADARTGGAAMTIDDVVVRTAAKLGTVVLTAVLSSR